MKFLWTNFRSLLHKFRAASLLNIVGLAVALAVAIVVAIQVRWDFTYDRGWDNAERIFTIRRYMHADGLTLGSSTWDWPGEVMKAAPEVENHTLFAWQGPMVFDVPGPDGTQVQHTVPYMKARGGFVDMFEPQIIAGDTTGVFSEPGRAMISRKIAERMFPGPAAVAVGRSLTQHSNGAPITIAAVYEDFPENQTVRNAMYSYIGEDVAGGSYAYDVYYLIEPELVSTVTEKLNSPEFLGEETLKYFAENPDAKMSIRLPALADMYLYGDRGRGSRQINTTLSLLAIGILVMLIAWINFINLAMAMAPSRVRSINIHRILGIGKSNLRVALAFEGMGLTLIALALALLGVYYFGTTPMADLFDSTLSLGANIPLIAAVAAISLTMAFLIGLYAARYSTGFDVAIALKSSFALSGRAGRLRNVLVVVQFTAAMALISIAGMIKIQHDYMMNRPWGFQKDNILYFDAYMLGTENREAFGEELKKDPRVLDWTVSTTLPSEGGHWSWNTRQWEGRTINTLTQWNVGHNFLRFFGIPIVAGNDFPDTEDGRTRIIFNEEFMRAYDFAPEDVIGRDYYGEVVGVAGNVHFYSMRTPLEPMAFVMSSGFYRYGYYLVKIAGNDIPGTLAYIEETYKKFTDTEFNYKFYDDELDALYRRESNMASLIGLFGLVTVIIAMMGVYGLIFFNTRYRTKEIAIRRVNGAETGGIVMMLNRAMFIQLGVALVAATAIAVFVIRRWLEGFAYRADVPWWLFVAAGLAVAAVSLATVSLQSWRAATVNPVKSLKSE